MDNKRRLSSFLTVGLLIVTTVGCNSGSDASSSIPEDVQLEVVDEFMVFDQMLEEFLHATRDFELPAGASFVEPVNPGMETLPDGSEGESLYQRGFGEAQVLYQWQCAWEQQWLDVRTSDPVAATRALDTLNSILENDVFVRTADPMSTVPHVSRMLEQATLGDPSLIQRDLELNCNF